MYYGFQRKILPYICVVEYVGAGCSLNRCPQFQTIFCGCDSGDDRTEDLARLYIEHAKVFYTLIDFSPDPSVS